MRRGFLYGMALLLGTALAASAQGVDYPSLLPLGQAWRVEQGVLHWSLEQTEAELQAFVQEFWRVERAVARAGLPLGYRFWFLDTPGSQGLRLEHIDVEHETMVCTSEVPLHSSAQRFLHALGCVWPES